MRRCQALPSERGAILSRQAPGEFVYLSERKLLNLARLYDEDPGWVETERTKERGANANVRFAQAGRRTATRSEPLDPRPRDRALEALLGQMLNGPMSGLPDLDISENGVREGEWFHFRRALRFGIGMSDSLTDPRFPDIMSRGECEGVAQVSLIGTHNETTVVMASPLYVRRSAGGFFGDVVPRDGLGARLKRRFRR